MKQCIYCSQSGVLDSLGAHYLCRARATINPQKLPQHRVTGPLMLCLPKGKAKAEGRE
jgi:hypothetical protein